MESNSETELTEKDIKEVKAALILYNRHREACKKYQQKNRDKMIANAKRYYESLRNDPEKYERYLERNRQRYVPIEVRRQKQKEQAEKEQNEKDAV